MRFSTTYGLLPLDFTRLTGWFGVPAAIAPAAAALVIFEIYPKASALIFAGLAAAWLAALAASLYAQGRGLSPLAGFFLQIAAAMCAAALVSFGRATSVSFEYFFPGLAAACFAAPAARLKDYDAYWVWAERFCVAAAFAYAAALIGWGAAMATLYSAEHLFSLFGSVLAGRLATDLAAIFFLAGGPVAFLALQPPLADETLAADAKDFIRRAIAALASWALAPFVLVYSALLWLYAGKIAIARALPDGQIGWMVAAFGVSALATIFLIAPQRRDGPPQTRLLWRIWPFLAVAPLALLAIAIHERVWAYGLTPDRYMLALMGALCAANAAVALMSREAVLRFAPVAGAVALVMGSVGPWGAVATSERWQQSSLREIYAAHGRLADGRLVMEGGVPAMSAEEAGRCRAAIEFLSSKEVDALGGLLAQSDKKLIGDAGNFCPAAKGARQTAYFNFYANSQWVPADQTGGYSILGYFQISSASKIQAGSLAITGEGSRIAVAWRGEPPAIFDMDEIARAQDPKSRLLLKSPLLKATSGDERLVFLVQSVSISRSGDGAAKLDYLNGFLLRRD